MGVLLPCYPEVRAKFSQDKAEGRSFEALELFFRHFLREGSVFSAFGLQNLREKRLLTELHLDDIQCQYRSMSEDLDLLDEAIVELGDSVESDGPDEPEESDNLPETDEPQEAEEYGEPQESDDPHDPEGSEDFDDPGLRDDIVNDPLQSDLRAAIERRDSSTVRQMLKNIPGVADERSLFRAMDFYDETVFRLLLKRGANKLGDDIMTKLLYRASEAGQIDAVQLILKSFANEHKKDTRCTNVSTTALAGAASGGHLNVVRYLVEEHGANIDGDGCRSPLSCAFEHCHREVFGYLLKAGAILPHQHHPKPLWSIDRQAYRFRLAELVSGLPVEIGTLFLSTESSQGHLDMVQLLVALGANFRSIKEGSPLYRATANGHVPVVRFLLNKATNIQIKDVELLMRCASENLVGHDSEIYPMLLDVMSRLQSKYGNRKMHQGKVTDVEDCPITAAIRARQRKTTVLRLRTKLKRSRKRLQAAGARHDASATLKAFVGQIGTGSSIWTWGTRAIREISEGYMPSSLADIVSVLQVANSMRVAVPRSRQVCSKQE